MPETGQICNFLLLLRSGSFFGNSCDFAVPNTRGTRPTIHSKNNTYWGLCKISLIKYETQRLTKYRKHTQ